MNKPGCTISARVSGPCDKCGKRADPMHLRLLLADNAPWEAGFYCADCCPVHSASKAS